MKRTVLTTLTLALLAAMLLTLPCHAKSKDAAAAISYVSGDVETATDRTSWLPAEVNGLLQPGHKIRTGKNSKAKLVLEDGSLIVLGPIAMLTIEDTLVDYKSSSAKNSFLLDSGSMRAVVPKQGSGSSEFTIKTPTAVAGVRGTDFSVEIGDDTTTTVTVFDGSVEVGSILSRLKERILVEKDHSSEIMPDKPPAAPRRLDPQKLKQKMLDLARNRGADSDTPGDDDIAADDTARAHVLAFVSNLPEDKKKALVQSIAERAATPDQARNIVASLDKDVKQDVAVSALEILARKDIPMNDKEGLAELMGRADDAAQIKERIQALASARKPAGDLDIEKLKDEIVSRMDKGMADSAIEKLDPNHPARKELQIIQYAIEKGIPREKLQPILLALRKGAIDQRETRMILEALKSGIDEKIIMAAIARMNRLKADAQIRALIIKAISSGVNFEALSERLESTDATPAQIKERIEALIKQRLQATQNQSNATPPK